MNIAKMIKSEFNDKDYSLSGIGGVETGYDAAEFILLGSNTVQVNQTQHYPHFYLVDFIENLSWELFVGRYAPV